MDDYGQVVDFTRSTENETYGLQVSANYRFSRSLTGYLSFGKTIRDDISGTASGFSGAAGGAGWTHGTGKARWI